MGGVDRRRRARRAMGPRDLPIVDLASYVTYGYARFHISDNAPHLRPAPHGPGGATDWIEGSIAVVTGGRDRRMRLLCGSIIAASSGPRLARVMRWTSRLQPWDLGPEHLGSPIVVGTGLGRVGCTRGGTIRSATAVEPWAGALGKPHGSRHRPWKRKLEQSATPITPAPAVEPWARALSGSITPATALIP